MLHSTDKCILVTCKLNISTVITVSRRALKFKFVVVVLRFEYSYSDFILLKIHCTCQLLKDTLYLRVNERYFVPALLLLICHNDIRIVVDTVRYFEFRRFTKSKQAEKC